ncbi:hypothetical protein J3R83DRAFT_13655 [Lanmaoa asiatica]|nr:hypothetical protein J3R83DRAFT_13655 [Lanmaoa asiatica]
MANCQLRPPSKSSLTDLETEPASDSGIPSSQPLCPEPSVLSVVPGTPHADSPHSLPSLESRPKIPQTESFRRVASQAIVSQVSTPSAVGTIRKSSTLSQFVTPAPVRGSLLVPRGLPNDVSWGTKHEGRVDQTDVDFDEADAQIVLEIARTRRTICRLEQELAEARCMESIDLIKLYKHRAEDARKRHDYAEFDLGLTRDMVTNNFNPSKLSIVRRPNMKRSRLSSPSEHQCSKYRVTMLVYTLPHQ